MGSGLPGRFRRLLALLLWFWLAALSAAPTKADLSSLGIGVNAFDLALQYQGRASGGDGGAIVQRVTQAKAQKAIADARDVGVRFMRVSVTGYAPVQFRQRGDLDLWLSNPQAYWALMDAMFADLDAAGMRLVPVFVWNSLQFPAMAGETERDLLTLPNARSRQLLLRYVRDFVVRYRNRPTIAFYELTNELDLAADFARGQWCATHRPAGTCVAYGDFTSGELQGFVQWLADEVRKLDAARPISSGFSMPRVAAWHLRQQPAGKDGRGPDWTADSPADFKRYLQQMHVGLDILSIHLYPKPDNLRFGNTDERSLHLLALAKEAADEVGKPLFVGEFGDADYRRSPESTLTWRAMSYLAEKRIVGAVWTWAFYQTNTYATRNSEATQYSLEPGLSDAMIDNLARENRRWFGLAENPPRADLAPPRAVLDWPLHCAQVTAATQLHASASDDSGVSPRVRFYLDKRLLGELASPPYSLPLGEVAPGGHDLGMVAEDRRGQVTQRAIRVYAGPRPEGEKCSVDTLNPR